MSIATDVGYPYGLYLHGQIISVGASKIEVRHPKLCTDVWTEDGVCHRDWPYKYATQPNVLTRFQVDVGFEAVQTVEDLAQLQYVEALDGNLDVCFFKRHTEVWQSAIAFTSLSTLRRHAFKVLGSPPTGAAAALATVVKAGDIGAETVINEGGGGSDYSVATADASGRTPLTIPSSKSCIVQYCGLFYMRQMSSELASPMKTTEDWAISLVESV